MHDLSLRILASPLAEVEAEGQWLAAQATGSLDPYILNVLGHALRTTRCSRPIIPCAEWAGSVLHVGALAGSGQAVAALLKALVLFTSCDED